MNENFLKRQGKLLHFFSSPSSEVKTKKGKQHNVRVSKPLGELLNRHVVEYKKKNRSVNRQFLLTGSCGRVAVLKHGEVMYKAEHFSRKPTKAASIAMWVKSSKPGLVRWFDVGDGKPKSPRVKHNHGKLVKVPKNQWIHLAGTFDSNDGIARVYVNGKLISERIGKRNQGLPDDFTATGIGQKFGDKFISFLDDVFMFDRVLAPAEVRMLYKKCEFNRMVLHFGFQNVNTTTHQLMDQSGLENNATIDSGK